jgi:hypothetical protein
MMSRVFPLCVGAGLALVAPSTGAMAANAVVPVSVDSTANVLTVKITAPVSLRAVLDAVCERTEASCKLSTALPDTRVEPRTIRGSWFDVVAELLHGSNLSFAVTPPVPGRHPYLVVELVAPPSRTGSDASAPSLARTDAVGTVEGAEAPAAEPEATPEEAPAAESSNDAPVASALSPDSPLVSASTAAATPGASFAMTPFADATGRPLLARVGPAGGTGGQATPGMAVLPYPDEIGNPIVVPITNEPLSLTPFTGPDGQAWPAPVAQPNQTLQYPIPPNVPPAKPDNQ